MSNYYKFEVKKTGYVFVKADNEDEAWDIINDADLSNSVVDEIEWNFDGEADETEADMSENDVLSKIDYAEEE